MSLPSINRVDGVRLSPRNWVLFTSLSLIVPHTRLRESCSQIDSMTFGMFIPCFSIFDCDFERISEAATGIFDGYGRSSRIYPDYLFVRRCSRPTDCRLILIISDRWRFPVKLSHPEHTLRPHGGSNRSLKFVLTSSFY